ncbi:cell wall metabolism sensor histidine kinase WalK [uncultured Clostridium sp.]|uniref:sensor histidine kinase n=1 Tax=uncultured Clostridium sp. TaxID=59620 RepID=UPI0026259B96|nr:HAMP domain-containing sensor histidine kinase [uncultured Clostridium sp.]
MHDITKFKEVEMLKTDFINTVSHEFRTPLTSIAMAINMLIESEYSEEKLELLNIAKEEELHLEKLVSELLDISKFESGKIEMEFEKVDIKKVLKGIKNTFKLQLEEKNIKLNIEILTEKIYIKADFNKISWVMINLIGNSIRYTDIGGIIEVEIKDIDKKMLISVKDNGRGIPKEYIEKIFEKFVQLKIEDEESNGSTGLGLAICKEIIKAHNGDIWGESEENQGATFFFTLKLEN